MDPQSLLTVVPTAWVPYATALVAVAAAMSTALPPPKQPVSGWYPVVYGVINWIGLNFGHAKNATAPEVRS